jgi:SH3-like domain-containing protein
MRSSRFRRLAARALLIGLCLLAPGAALAEEAGKGPVTNLPLPRYVSLKTDEANVRRGPSLSHRIDWVFRHRDMPLKVTGEFANWRRVEDNEGQGGWVHYTLISGVRTVLFEPERTALRSQPDPEASEVAEAEAGVIGRLGACKPDWCRVTAGGETGWVEKSAIWGVDPEELRD